MHLLRWLSRNCHLLPLKWALTELRLWWRGRWWYILGTTSFSYHGWALWFNGLLVSGELPLQILILLIQSLRILVSLVHFASHMCDYFEGALETLVCIVRLRGCGSIGGQFILWLFEQNGKRFVGLDKLGDSRLFEQRFGQSAGWVQNGRQFLFDLFITSRSTLTNFLTITTIL